MSAFFGYWALLTVAAGALVLLNAVFVACEFSLIKLRFSHFNPDFLEELERQKGINYLLNRLDRTFRFLRLGIVLCTLGLGLLIFPFFQAATRWLGLADNTGIWWLLLAVSFLVAIALRYVIGELVPRAVALRYPVQALRRSVWFVRACLALAHPLLELMDWASRALLRWLRLDPRNGLNLLDVGEQIESLEGDSQVPVFSQQMLKNVISMRDLVVQDVMLPRNQIRFFEISNSNAFNMALAKRTGHTRFPLCEGDLDNCVGIVHIKDIFRSDLPGHRIDFRKMARPVVYTGPDETLEGVLQELMGEKLHMALVRDEFGGTVGVVTLENIVEELVGNIQDEFDSEEEQIEELQRDVFMVDGLTPLHEIEDRLGIGIEEEEVSTIGGLMTSVLGKIPEAGQKVAIENLEIEAVEVDEKRLISAKVRLTPTDGG
ncbi:MAG: DUF21 domain-containing protein [Opitutae bacterium]|nr:DUF21 domain-containing protein [Opitutae bacterium]MBC9889233.1 DUF21 domain-containing protein [Opitutae bacterium]